MTARLRAWVKTIKIPLFVLGIIAASILVIVIIVGIIGGYLFHWDWTGLNGYNNVLTAIEITASPQKITKTIAYQPGKTLWDWLQLLIIPAVLAVAGYVINLTVSRGEQEATKQRDQTERDIAADNQHENALQAYLDKMSELLLVNDLRKSTEEVEVRNIARIRTLTVLRRLDAERKGSVLRFLYESGLIDKDTSFIDKDKRIIDLSDADLSKADLSKADLSKANLSYTNLSGAILSEVNLSDVTLNSAKLSKADLSLANLDHANLSFADLSGANLSGANLNLSKLFRANLSGANLSHAYLDITDLSETNLSGANLSEAGIFESSLSYANLSGANLSGANLSKAGLIYANLSGADLSYANLSGARLFKADLSGADLSYANLSRVKDTTPEQLDKARSLKDTVMPDGTEDP